jgi:hypothetical protein
MEEKKKSIGSAKYLLAAFLILSFGFVAIVCGGILFLLVLPTDNAATNRSSAYDVEYRVLGNSYSADVTYENAGGNTEQKELNQSTPFNRSPWTLALPNMEAGDFVYISAQTNHRGATIGCEIRVNGAVVESATSEGDYVIATCSGSVR